MKTEDHFFEYQSESVRSALVFVFIFVVAALFVPLALLRLILLAFAAGPVWWSLIQLLRRNRGVTITNTSLTITLFASRNQTVNFSNVQSAAIVFGNHLAVAYIDPYSEQLPPSPTAHGNIALIDARPRDAGPKRRLIVSGPVKNIARLEETVQVKLEHLGISDPLPEGFLTLWAKRRRIRNRILVILALMATPLYAIVLFRIFGSLFM